MVIGAFEKAPICLTTTTAENRELRTARTIAAICSAAHIPVNFSPQDIGTIMDPALRISGGMYSFDHARFLGYRDLLREHADVYFHGHGFDFLFQGMYLPAKHPRIRGRALYYRSLAELPKDVAPFFIDNLSFRTKQTELPKYLLPETLRDTRKMLEENARAVLVSAANNTDEYDLWDHLCFHHFTRHYSFPNLASISSSVEQRTVVFDNDIFNFYLSLPVQQRFDGRIQRRALPILSSELAKIPNANTRMPITASSFTQTFYQLAFILRNRFRSSKADIPGWKERSWPSREYIFRNEGIYADELRDIAESEILAQIPFLNTAKLKQDIPAWLEGQEVPEMGADFLQLILTIGAFLKLT